LLTVGKTIQEAFINMYLFENTCRIQIDAQSGGAELNYIGAGPIAANANISKVATAGQGSNLAWPALLRKLDRENPGYAS
jgi:ribulose-5-phosphate 4-epimerase/fuculose-1-phosphate aldolase